jgi:nitroimidazol reductase NimA-like FMN-containing flavoprotein (pyridoxamine 5'-phosphate oxidase superfamily)
MGTISGTKVLLKQIVKTQYFGVLATLSNQQPYTNLVAFAASDDLKRFIFTTNRYTQKYRNIISNNKIALLIDNRSNNQLDFSRALAITVLGIAEELSFNKNDELVQFYLARHPSLFEFLNKPDTAVVNIVVTDFILAHFDRTDRIPAVEIF